MELSTGRKVKMDAANLPPRLKISSAGAPILGQCCLSAGAVVGYPSTLPIEP